MSGVLPGETLCARVLANGVRVQGVGAYAKGQLVPIDLRTAPQLELELQRTTVEVVIGIPQPPVDPVNPTLATGADLFYVPKREAVHKWAKDAVEKRANELLREKPSSFFATRSPLEIASDDVYAKRTAQVEKERKRRQDALERLRAELPKKAERLRQEAAERERQAKLADAEASKIDAAVANADAAGVLLALRARLDEYAKISNAITEDVMRASTQPNTFFGRFHELLREAIASVKAGDTEKLRAALDELDAVYKAKSPEMGPIAGIGFSPGFSVFSAGGE